MKHYLQQLVVVLAAMIGIIIAASGFIANFLPQCSSQFTLAAPFRDVVCVFNAFF